jgi:hypothetical protein
VTIAARQLQAQQLQLQLSSNRYQSSYALSLYHFKSRIQWKN